MIKTVIKLENISKKYGSFLALVNINLEVQDGEIIGLIGPNGAGKTTTLKLIAKLLRPNSGKILLRNIRGELQDINKNSKELVQTGFFIDIPQFYNATPYRLLKLFAKIKHYPKEKINQRIDELLTTFNLIDWKDKKVKTFSKGMLQKLGFIQAVIHDPEILFLDEPQTGLDPNARIDIRNYIRFLKQQGKTIFVASHLLYEISEVCDKVALINQGSIINFDTIDNLEKNLKSIELNFEVLNPIPTEMLGSLIKRLTQNLEPYLDKELDPSISKIPIKYKPQENSFTIFYNGVKKARGDILNILFNDFKSDFTLISFSKPKTSSLERIYSQIISDDNKKK
jgi:ABC-2 type transport system ATP-binding protein